MEALTNNPMTGFSLLPVWVLVGLFQYLRRFTGQRHFQTWTSAWLFYALFLTLSVLPGAAGEPVLVSIAKHWCIATSALLMLWGTFQLINVPARQRLIAMMLVFNLIWSCAIAGKHFDGAWDYFPAFAFLAVASGFTAFCVFSGRSGQAQKGAALLTLGFGLWSLFLLCSPFLQASETLVSAGFMLASALQLFIAISLCVLVLEQTRGRAQSTSDALARQTEQNSRLREEAAEASESYRLLFENSREALALVTEEDLEIVRLNSAARKVLGLKEPAPGLKLGNYCSLPHHKPGDAKALRDALPANPEVELALHDGATVRAQLLAQAVQIGGRKVFQVILAGASERVHLGRHMRGSGKLSALGQVISGVAHELNNPLAAIKGYTDLLLLTGQLDPQTRSALLKVSQESNRAARLVRDLVAFARPETPRIDPFNMADLIRGFVEQRRADLEAKQIQVELALHPGTALALGSAEQLQQVLAHLLNNAAEAIEDGEGDRLITVSTANLDSKIQIRIEDSGPGIDPDVLPRIFEPFFTTKPVGSGTGLGLSVCYSILLQHRGSIRYEPGLLGGACFIIELPAAFSTVQPASNIATADFGSRKTGAPPARILVVDDEPSVVALLNDMLTLLGHHVTCETSPYEAFARLEEREFDAILSDFRMPGMTGGELFRKAVRLNPALEARFLFLTGDMMDPDTNGFFKAENVRCLLKPFQFTSLQHELSEILSGKGTAPMPKSCQA